MNNLRIYFSGLLTVLFLFTTGCSVDEDESKISGGSNELPLGASARDFLSDENYTALKIEVVSVTGYEPSPTALSTLRNFLETYTHKPGGISLISRSVAAPGVGTYSLAEIRDVEKQHRTVFTSGNTLGAFIFFADRKSESAAANKIVLGKAYKNTSLVIFEKEIIDLASSSQQTNRSTIEHTTLRHEFGHLFGLVNNGSPAQSEHEDSNPDHKAHCNVEGCLMAASLEFSSNPLDLSSNQVLDLDEKCRLDLTANGGK